MCKTIRNMYDKKLTFNNIIRASERAHKNKSYKSSVLKFDIRLENNLINIYNSLQQGQYKTGKYHTFTIYEPKERNIKALPFKDRIVQQWYIEEFIKPYIIPRLITDTYACIENRETHKSIYKIQKYMRIKRMSNKNYYILKCDIHKFFYSVDKDILYKIMGKYIKDKKLLNLTKIFIYDDENKKGIPIGNYTSQYYANIYLNELDQYIKRKLLIKYYVRYMDDFILLLDSKDECKKYLLMIDKFIRNNLHLELNEKSGYYPNKIGINFCGYRVFNTHILLRKRSVKKIKNNIKNWTKLKDKDELDYDSMERSLKSWLAHAKHANSYNLISIVKGKVSNLYNN